MQNIILVTGATDGIGLETAKKLVTKGHHVIIHGRNPSKVTAVQSTLKSIGKGKIDSLVADLSSFEAICEMINTINQTYDKLDVIINNAGIFSTSQTITDKGLDVRFMVNTIAPYLITHRLQPVMTPSSRVINLSSAAQAPVNLLALEGKLPLSDGEAYAQSKLALTMWSRKVGTDCRTSGPLIVAVNPKSFLGSKMVKDAYGVAGGDISQGADILVKAAISDEFAHAYGEYFDNDIEAFTSPHRDALDNDKISEVLKTMEKVIAMHSTLPS